MKWIIVAAFGIGALTNAVWWFLGYMAAKNTWLPDSTLSIIRERIKFHKIGTGWDLLWTCLAISLLQ